MNLLLLAMIVLLGTTTALQPPGVRQATSISPGIAARGLAVALAGPTQPIHLGETIPVTVEIRNVTSGPLYVIYRGRKTGYKFRVVDQGSKTIELRTEGKPGLYEVFSGSSSGSELPAGASYFIDLRLDDYVDFVKPGTYRITVRANLFLVNQERTASEVLTLQPSNPITVTVVP